MRLRVSVAREHTFLRFQQEQGCPRQSRAQGDAEKAKNGTKVEALPNWTLHDLRRTAKTLMVRAGVRPDISERVLGHVIAGVEGTYDRHSYADEKRDALEKLAAMVERILNPLPSNVENLGEHRAAAQS